jgi:hypothetical protein
VPLLYQELLTLREHLSSPPLCSGVPVTLSLILYVCFVDRCLSFCTFSFGHCLVCPSIYGLPFWYLQTLLIVDIRIVRVVKLLITQILLFCFSTIFQLHRNGRLYVWRKTSWQNTHIPKFTEKLLPAQCIAWQLQVLHIKDYKIVVSNKISPY